MPVARTPNLQRFRERCPCVLGKIDLCMFGRDSGDNSIGHRGRADRRVAWGPEFRNGIVLRFDPNWELLPWTKTNVGATHADCFATKPILRVPDRHKILSIDFLADIRACGTFFSSRLPSQHNAYAGSKPRTAPPRSSGRQRTTPPTELQQRRPRADHPRTSRCIPLKLDKLIGPAKLAQR